MASKAVKFSISLTPEQHAKALAAAEQSHGGNLSRYFQSLLDRAEGSDDGARALVRLNEITPGNYTARFTRAVADGQSFASIALDLSGGDAEILTLLRKAYDFLAGTMKAPTQPPIMTAILEIRDMLREGAVLPLTGEKPQAQYGGPIPSSPSAEVISQILHKEGRGAKAGGAASHRRTRRASPAKPPRDA